METTFYVFIARGVSSFRVMLPEGAWQHWQGQFHGQYPPSQQMRFALIEETGWQYPAVGNVADYRTPSQLEPFFAAIEQYLTGVAGLTAEAAGAALAATRRQMLVQIGAADNTLAFGVPVGLSVYSTGPSTVYQQNPPFVSPPKQGRNPLPPAQVMASVKVKPTAFLYFIPSFFLLGGLALIIVSGIFLQGNPSQRFFLLTLLVCGISCSVSGVIFYLSIAVRRHKYKKTIDYNHFDPVYVSTRSKMTAVVLCAVGFSGFAGLHRIYTGKVVSGILCFLTAGGCYVWTAIDLFALLDNQFLDRQNRLPLPKNR
ncbi:NINE protein [Ruminococcaceae bacterium OttesenSCG-928-I18]|nr:NINE protein [Ruminococcaceae bacterium OttesenSCG-928-I18]